MGVHALQGEGEVLGVCVPPFYYWEIQLRSSNRVQSGQFLEIQAHVGLGEPCRLAWGASTLRCIVKSLCLPPGTVAVVIKLPGESFAQGGRLSG